MQHPRSLLGLRTRIGVFSATLFAVFTSAVAQPAEIAVSGSWLATCDAVELAAAVDRMMDSSSMTSDECYEAWLLYYYCLESTSSASCLPPDCTL